MDPTDEIYLAQTHVIAEPKKLVLRALSKEFKFKKKRYGCVTKNTLVPNDF